jgi:hypothetical protein
MNKISFFILSHQDDEFGIFYEIEKARNLGLRIKIIYLTNGCYGVHSELKRNDESTKVLIKLGVLNDEIIFLGGFLGIRDAEIILRMPDIYNSLLDIIGGERFYIANIFTSAQEGGHQDHDATNFLVSKIALNLDLLDKVRQFPLYHGKCHFLRYYKVLSPISDNGEILNERIPFLSRFKFLALCFLYRSQFWTFVGLWPFLLLHYCLKGTQQTQSINFDRIGNRPHSGRLLYEKRGRADFSIVKKYFMDLNCEIRD